jgi:hypothetical protein
LIGSEDTCSVAYAVWMVQVQVILRPTVGRPVCLGVGPPDQIFISVGHLRSSYCEAPSLTRGRVCKLLVQFAVTLRYKSRRTHDRILLYQLRLPPPGGPGPRIYIPRNRVAQLHPRALGSFFDASYDWQGYGGGILSRLYTGHSGTWIKVKVTLLLTVGQSVSMS